MSKKPFKAVDGPMIMLVSFALMLVAQVVMSFMLISVDPSDVQAYEVVNCIAMILFQLVYLAVYIVYTKKRKIVSAFSFRNKITAWGILAAVAVTVVCFFGFIGPAYYFEHLLGSIGYKSPGLEVNTPIGIVLLVLATVIAAPICEESIFRSALISGLSKSRRDELGICVISGLCFALMHINPSQTVYQFCLGAVAAYVMLKTRNVISAMIIHSLSNALALIMSYSNVGLAVDAFYAQAGVNVLITLLTCVLLPAVAVTLIWLVCKYVKKVEKKAFPDKFKADPQVIWIDEATKEPIYEGGSVPQITEENRTLKKGFNPYTGEPVIVDRLELQKALMEEYKANNGEKAGGFGKKSYQVAFAIYFCITVFMWLLTFGTGFII